MALVDWEIFTTQMTAIFTCILDFTFRETHSLPTMFNPLPYVSLDGDRVSNQLIIYNMLSLANTFETNFAYCSVLVRER